MVLSPAPCMAAVTPQMLVKAAEAYLLSLEAPKLTQTFRSTPPFPEATREAQEYGKILAMVRTHREFLRIMSRDML